MSATPRRLTTRVRTGVKGGGELVHQPVHQDQKCCPPGPAPHPTCLVPLVLHFLQSFTKHCCANSWRALLTQAAPTGTRCGPEEGGGGEDWRAASDPPTSSALFCPPAPLTPYTGLSFLIALQPLPPWLPSAGPRTLAPVQGPKQRKAVDRRASKGRKLRYHVHEKLVNFMTPVELAAPQYAAQLFSNLFGGGGSGGAARQ